MTDAIGSARAYSNIAFIKYWGNTDHHLRLPANGSISMNLEGVETVTTVHFDESLIEDMLFLGDEKAAPEATQRASTHLSMIRDTYGKTGYARIVSRNNFPMGTGIASSASAFAALTVAALSAWGIKVSEREASTLARRGSGSAARSIPGGFVEWYKGNDHESSYAESIAPTHHWDLVDLIAIVSSEHKAVGSTGGHKLASTSPLQQARIDNTPRRLAVCRQAIHDRDFGTFAEVVEHDTLIMHGVMMTSSPSLMYWVPPTLALMQRVRELRTDGINAAFTIDAGPNVHIITTRSDAGQVMEALEAFSFVNRILEAGPGGRATAIAEHMS